MAGKFTKTMTDRFNSDMNRGTGKPLDREAFRKRRASRKTAQQGKSTMTDAERAALARQKAAEYNKAKARRKAMGRG